MKSVYCFDLDKDFKSAQEASKFTNVDRTSIIKCCNLQRITAGRYVMVLFKR